MLNTDFLFTNEHVGLMLRLRDTICQSNVNLSDMIAACMLHSSLSYLIANQTVKLFKLVFFIPPPPHLPPMSVFFLF